MRRLDKVVGLCHHGSPTSSAFGFIGLSRDPHRQPSENQNGGVGEAGSPQGMVGGEGETADLHPDQNVARFGGRRVLG